MRTAHWIAASGGLAGLAMALTVGCWSDYNDLYLPLTNPALADAGGGEGGPPPGCIPSTATTPIADACGVFVSSSMGNDTAGKGTKEAPYQTLTKALGVANGQPVYACGEAFKEAVTLSAKVDLFGALDCANGWAYDASKKTQLTAGADAVPMTLTNSAGGSSVNDFAISAADAMMAGGSSVAVLDDQADVTLENVNLVAGAGKDGAPGMAQNQVMTPVTADGKPGTDDASCSNAGPISGGNGGKNTCGATDTSGGLGGQGAAATSGGPGGSGSPMTTSNGGSGETKTASCNVNDPKGGDGSVGSSGTGARGVGDISSAGYTGPSGAAGGSGTPGQGGGGGGGARQCDVNGMFAGPSGGGGGAGGCGGLPGNPGQSGGSSIGILALGVTPVLKTVSITIHNGGAGGLGGDGQLGQSGGQPGAAGGSAACSGGKGGQGGPGGPGGGGAGGHSAGIAIKAATLPDLSTTTIVPGSGGMGGAGGDMDMTAGTKGDSGLACKTLDFTPASAMPCTM